MAPFKMPDLLTINDFVSTLAGKKTLDKVSLVLELYECYKELNPKAESLDDFIFWGDILLGDFSDVDNYLINPDHIFANVSEYREIQDGFSFLDEDQRIALESLVRHFKSGGVMKVDPEGDGVKEKFLKIWNLLLPLYKAFNSRLEAKGETYDGGAYRSLAARLDKESISDISSAAYPDAGKFIFVGLNALNECEKKVLGKMRNAGLAEFCWDYGKGMISDPESKSSLFMERNISAFPPAFVPDPEGLDVPEINVVSVPSSTGQAKQVAGILRQTGPLESVGTLGSGSDCAIVIPDEGLLEPLLNSIPEEIRDINVTMGRPMSDSAFFDFMSEALTAQLHTRCNDGIMYFYYRQAGSIFSSPVFRAIAGENDMKTAENIRSGAKYFIPEGDFADGPFLSRIFTPVVKDLKSSSPDQVKALGDWLAGLVEDIAPLLVESDLAVEAEFARRYYNCLNRLRTRSLPVTPTTFIRLLGQLLALESVPFEGEPLRGLQIMGPLETRALDFSNLIVLSCNEGVFPRRSVSSSFIPPELRRGFGLPSFEYQDAVWSYYFYRMIRRSKRVWLLYDSRTEGMETGEESRFIKQLQYQFRVPIRRWVAMAPASAVQVADEIPKPADMAERLKEMRLSASSLKNWLDCPVKFYYHSIEKLKADEEVAESMDGMMLGRVYHATMQALYLGPAAMDPSFSMESRDVAEAIRTGALVPLKKVSAGYLESWQKKGKQIKARIRSLVKTELHTVHVSGKDLVTEDIILRYVLQTLKRDSQILDEKGLDGFEVLGLELRKDMKICGYNFTGVIDRLDSFGGKEVRVVDYKTGSVTEKDILINDVNAESIVGAIFDPDSSKRPKIALQMYIYDKFMEGDPAVSGKTLVNAIYQPGRLFSGEEYKADTCSKFIDLMDKRLARTLEEMADPSVPLRRVKEGPACKFCDFKKICGRQGTDY